MELRQRKKNRLEGYDYGRPGCYFITVCTNGREHFFWDETSAYCVGADIIRPYKDNPHHCGSNETHCFPKSRVPHLAEGIP